MISSSQGVLESTFIKLSALSASPTITHRLLALMSMRSRHERQSSRQQLRLALRDTSYLRRKGAENNALPIHSTTPRESL